MGRADAKARRDDLLAFFGDPSEDGGGLLDGDEFSGSLQRDLDSGSEHRDVIHSVWAASW